MNRTLSLVAGLILSFLAPAASAGEVGRERLEPKTFSGIVRCMGRCDPQDAADLGMKQTGSEPVFEAGFDCRGIDEGWAIDYAQRRGRPALHGGIDIPAPEGTPLLAIADGVVVALFDNHETAVGVRIFLQHAPGQTGLPFWIYSEYAHLAELPPLAVGQKVRQGEKVGRTSHSGISGAEAKERAGGFVSNRLRSRVRRDAVHFSILYSDSPDYVVLSRNGGYLVPVDGRWMDPVAVYRSAGPYDSDRLAALPESEKRVPISFVDSAATVHPSGSRLIWPYACDRR